MLFKLILLAIIVTANCSKCDNGRPVNVSLTIVSATVHGDNLGERCDYGLFWPFDWMRECDTYVKVMIGRTPNSSVREQTSAINDSPNPIWNQQILVNVSACGTDILHMVLMDSDIGTEDDELGSYQTTVATASFGEQTQNLVHGNKLTFILNVAHEPMDYVSSDENEIGLD